MIEIVDYRPAWPREFEAVAARVRAALGHRALAVHHIGSTAVPGLASKDVIDVQVTVAALTPALVGDLTDLGFTARPDVTADHLPRGLDLPPEDLAKLYVVQETRRAHVHLREQGRFNQRYALLCRDYLRAHPLAANAYADVKRQLARHVHGDTQKYYDVKDPVFDIIMAGAFDWAATARWAPPPTDA